MLGVIGVSTAFEYGLKSMYEGTVGRVFEWIGPDSPTPEERVAARVNADYARFIAIRPWYEFGYPAARRALWAASDTVGPGWARRLERRFILTVEFTIKGWYARLIGGGTQTVYAADEDSRWILVAGSADSADVPNVRKVASLDRGYHAVRVPRYAGVRDALLALAATPSMARAVELSGNERVAITGIAPRDWRPSAGLTPIMAYAVPADPARIRVVLDVAVMDLVRLLAEEARRGLRVDHVYDY